MGAGLGIDRFLAASVGSGAKPFALAAVDGGPDNYWHRRTTGDDPRRMLFDEFVPLLGRQGLRASRIGLLGWSMGGYGALLAAAELGPSRVAAVVASSPALWLDPADAAPGAFDGPDDFRSHDVFARTADLARVPLRIDCGREDPFASATRELRSAPLAGTGRRYPAGRAHCRLLAPDAPRPTDLPRLSPIIVTMRRAVDNAVPDGPEPYILGCAWLESV